MRVALLFAVAVALSAEGDHHDTREVFDHERTQVPTAKQSVVQMRDSSGSLKGRSLSNSRKLLSSQGVAAWNPAKERTEKCLAKLDDAQAAMATATASQLQRERQASVGQPIVSTEGGRKCLTHEGESVKMQTCDSKNDNQRFIHNSLAGGTLTSKDSKRCLQRNGETVTMRSCDGLEHQIWRMSCGAWVNGEGKEGRMLDRVGDKVRADQWYARKSQLWEFKEVVKHSKCSNKRFKVMEFDGTTGAAVHLRNYIGMPSSKFTLSMWLKGTKGTPFSYASKNRVKSVVLSNIDSLTVHIRDFKVDTKVDFSTGKWEHLGVTWNSENGNLVVYKNGKAEYTGQVAKLEKLTAGGCLVLGQLQQQQCGDFDPNSSFSGQISDVQMFNEVKTAAQVRPLMHQPVATDVVTQVQKLERPEPPEDMRLAFLSRQYGSQELNKENPPSCDLDQYLVKKIEGPAGWMAHKFTGSGDVHYRNFHGCCFDDQSVGEWTVVKVDEDNWAAAPLMIQFRTSPNKINRGWCTWCQNGAVSYIDGCAVKFHGDQASAGFGGYNDGPYPPYAAINGQPTRSYAWVNLKNMKVRAHGHNFEAVLNDGTQVRCHRGGSIYINMPKKYTGKIGGLAGTGMGGASDWKCGPNTDACPECTPGKQLDAMNHECPRHYVYSQPEHVLNGNRLSKPLVKWFKSWQVDGNTIPSVFYYGKGHDGKEQGPGSFNRNTGEKLKPPADDKNPTGKRKEAHDACKDFRDAPKAREKCIFDFLLMGKDALKGTKKDRMDQRKAAIKVATEKSVRDISKFRNDAQWAGSPSWGCVGEFEKVQEAAQKKAGVVEVAPKVTPEQHKEKATKCEAKMANQLQALRTLSAGQPIMSKDKKKCMVVSGGNLGVQPCTGGNDEKLVYNRLAGGTLHTRDGKLCVTREKSEEPKVKVTMEPCKASPEQQWKRLCGAWANGEKKAGRVLEFDGDKVQAAQWEAKDHQLSHYQEVVKHSQCGNKRFKTLDFDGTDGSAVIMRNFIGMPSYKLTVAAWIKGTQGTVFSYASKHKLNSFVIRNPENLEVHIRDTKIVTGINFASLDEWVHIAATWESKRGKISVYKNGKRVFKQTGFAKGARITAGGCLIVGQSQSKFCRRMVTGQSFRGQITDLQMWAEDLRASDLRVLRKFPVPEEVVEKAGSSTAPEAPKKLRLAFLSRQYGSQELNEPNPPVCDLDEFKIKKITGPSGNMQWHGSGDVHYRNFAGCKYDDQSVGEWTAVKVDKEHWDAAPLMIQYRTSPQYTNCHWCQNGAVSYIDGCAIKFHGDQASAGFGGYSQRYQAYAAANGQQLTNWHVWKDLKEMKVRGNHHHFEARLTDGTRLTCHRGGSIYLNLPRKYTGKIGGIAGTGEGGSRDWKCGPNSGACPECKEGQLLSRMKNECPPHYVYGQPSHPLNGNHPNKPLVRWFKSWQVDGNTIPSVFYYTGDHGVGSFNRNAGQAIKPPTNTNKNPKGKRKEAHDACKDFRDSPKAREKCIFDFMAMGKGALKATKKDRMGQRQMNLKKPTDRSVRDLSRYKNDGVWAAHRNWGCIGDFLEMQGELSTAKPKKVRSPLKYIVASRTNWDPKGSKPLFGAAPTDLKNRYQASLKDCQAKCQDDENCIGISRYANDGQGGNCWGWEKGSASVTVGHMVSYTIDRTGSLTKALAEKKEFDTEAVNGTTVRIDLPGDKQLNLAEVGVFDADGVELEISDVSMSSVEDQSSEALMCADGNVDTYCSTKPGAKASWISVNLGGYFRIGKVSLINRKQCCQDRIKGAVVSVLSGNNTVVWESSALKGNLASYDLLTKPILIPGSFVAMEGGNNKMWCRDGGSKGIQCNSRRVSDWQKFKVVDGGDGKIALLGGKHHHKKYCAVNERGKWVCDAEKMDTALFRPMQMASGIAFKSEAGKYCKDGDSGAICTIPAAQVSAETTFSIKCLEGCGPAAEDDEGKLPLGSFYLKSATHNRCVHPQGTPDDSPLVYHTGCDGNRLLFKLVAGNKGYFLQMAESGKCVQPYGGEADEDGVKLVLGAACDFDRYLFEVTSAGGGAWYLKNKESERCVRPLGGSANKDNTNLVFDEACSGEDFKFLLEPPADEAVQLETFKLAGSRENWRVLGPTTAFGAKAAPPVEAKNIQSYVKTSRGCIGYKTEGDKRDVYATTCSKSNSKVFIYDRLGGGLLKDGTAESAYCLTRFDDQVYMTKCTGASNQQWKRECGNAWANGDGASGRVLALKGSKIIADQWTAEAEQKWKFEEVVKHNECGNKRFKTMSFDGSTRTSIIRRNFIGIPSKRITVTAWVKGTFGTLFSYASKHKVDSLVVEQDSTGLLVSVRGNAVSVPVKVPADQWTHLAISWDNRAGDISVFKNGQQEFHKRGVAAKEQLTAGGCLVVGQKQRRMCSGFITGKSYSGELNDLQVWKGVLNPRAITAVMQKPVPDEVIKKAGHDTAPEAHKNLRLAYIARQYASQELAKPICELDKYKVKRITGETGNMGWGGSGDVHYSNFAGCKYDDQSVGEWTALKINKEYWDAAPLMIQFRTSPQYTNCHWCQNGAVSYIDGCAVKFHGDQASAGFGGFSQRYQAYAAVNGKQMNSYHIWHRKKNMKVRADASRFQAILTDGTRVNCRRHSISISVPRKYKGKIGGIAGDGQGGNTDWKTGPNTHACPECKTGHALSTMKGVCSRRYVYGDPNHAFNGNRASKPIVRFFKSWQVDGVHIPSVFFYKGSHQAGSFNRNAREAIKPPSGTNKQGEDKKKEAKAACKDFRESPKMREKCIFDFMIMGKKALKDSKKDRVAQRMDKVVRPTARSVRDISRYKNDGEWSNRVSWACVGDFLEMQGSSIKRFSAKKKEKVNLAELHKNSPMIVPKGQWIESSKEFGLPFTMEAEIQAVGSSGTILVSVFNKEAKLDTGLTLETGYQEMKARVFQKGDKGKQVGDLGDNSEWHTVSIAVDSDGHVSYSANGKLLYKSKTTLNKGRVAFLGGDRAISVKNVKVTTAASEGTVKKRKCLATAARHPQDAGDVYKLPPCPAFDCDPTVCLCTCPGVRCDTFEGVVGRA